MVRRRAAGRGDSDESESDGTVDQDAACEVCGDEQHEVGNDMIFCDICEGCYHFGCLQPRLDQTPAGVWLCPRCRDKGERATYRFAKGQGSSRAERRAECMPAAGEVITLEHLDQFLKQRWAPSTRGRYERAEGKFLDACKSYGWDEDAPTSLALYILLRVQAKVSAETIRGEAVGIQQLRPGLSKSMVVQHALQAAVRVADRPSQEKLPLTPGQLLELRLTIATWDVKLSQVEVDRVRRRDWAFMIVAYIGFFRGSELSSLRWRDVKFIWRPRAGRRLIESDRPEAPRQDLELVYTIITVQDAKTDRAGDGQAVRLAAAATGSDMYDCPVRMLQRLWTQRAGQRPGDFVFCDERDGHLGHQLKTDTMRSRLKQYLTAFLGKEEAANYSLHSLRKGGATAAARLGRPMREIKRQGRWRSDVAYLYTLASDQDLLHLSQELLRELGHS